MQDSLLWALPSSLFPPWMARPPGPSAQMPQQPGKGLGLTGEMTRVRASLSLATPSSLSVALSFTVAADLDGASYNGLVSFLLLRHLPVIPLQ